MNTPVFILNVTTKINHAINNEWLIWMRNVYIPEMIATGCFTKAVIMKLKEQDDTEGCTYAVQYFTNSEEKYNTYLEQFATAFKNKSFSRWDNQFISFSTFMEVVD